VGFPFRRRRQFPNLPINRAIRDNPVKVPGSEKEMILVLTYFVKEGPKGLLDTRFGLETVLGAAAQAR
jgi:hypothetical protein